MSNYPDSSFSFHTKRPRQFEFPQPLQKKQKKVIVTEAVLHINSLGIPLISSYSGQICESLALESGKHYTIGRKSKSCDFVFIDSRVSKKHCQIYFDYLKKKIYLSDGLLIGYSGYSDSSSSTNGTFVNGVRINGVVELCVGDFVLLVCGKEEGCGLGASVGFLVRKTVFVEEIVSERLSINRLDNATLRMEPCRGIDNGTVLVSWCRDVLGNYDPISYICKYIDLDRKNRIDFSALNGIRKCSRSWLNNHFQPRLSCGFRVGWHNQKRVYPKEVIAIESCFKEIQVVSEENKFESCNVVDVANADAKTQTSGEGVDVEDAVVGCSNTCGLSSGDLDFSHYRQHLDYKNCGGCISPPKFLDKEIQVVSEENQFDFRNAVDVANADAKKQVRGEGLEVEEAVVGYSDTYGLSSVDLSSSHCGQYLGDKNCGGCILPPGKKFYLNRLRSGGKEMEEADDVVSLPELFHPIESLNQVFIATFTSDIMWFLTYCKIPPHLPVTIACHSSERCWSSDPDKRTSVPFPNFPNLTVVYPPFPEVIAFNKDRKNSGIACHHPKLIILQREDKLRVVVSSANLVENQWRNVTNTVWWQDFPRLNNINCLPLFTRLSAGEISIDTKCDFAAQLAGFVASLVTEVPSQAYWILELIKYDFDGAAGYLVTSIPGIYSHRSPCVYTSKNLMVGNGQIVECSDSKFLSTVEASVVGLSHIYHTSTDSNGEHLKKLAIFLGKCHANIDGMSEVVLRRVTNIPADGNAVSVLIPDPECFPVGDVDLVQLGFLPRSVAKWVAPLADSGLFAFSAYINPKEVLATALEGSNNKVKLILYVYTGPCFFNMSEVTLSEHVSAICSLVSSSQRYSGLWRLKEVLDLYKWPEHLESDFFFGSSSVGCLNAQFLAAFSAAAGKKSVPFSDSEESDPDWGRWSASQELKNPSMRIIFPSIERVKSNRTGIMGSRRILCFSQKTWERLENVGILHDAVPNPNARLGFPMHVKVGRRRFQSKDGSSSFGWVYCGSHNFSGAAWGRPVSNATLLHISNYELGIIFIVPPPASDATVGKQENLDDIVLPYVVPPPKYRSRDRPATARAMREALIAMQQQETSAGDDWLEEEEEEEDEEERASEKETEKEEEKVYADQLWTQV